MSGWVSRELDRITADRSGALRSPSRPRPFNIANIARTGCGRGQDVMLRLPPSARMATLPHAASRRHRLPVDSKMTILRAHSGTPVHVSNLDACSRGQSLQARRVCVEAFMKISQPRALREASAALLQDPPLAPALALGRSHFPRPARSPRPPGQQRHYCLSRCAHQAFAGTTRESRLWYVLGQAPWLLNLPKDRVHPICDP